MTEEVKYLSAKQVGSIVGLHPETISTYARDGQIRSYKLASARRYLLAEVVEDLQKLGESNG